MGLPLCQSVTTDAVPSAAGVMFRIVFTESPAYLIWYAFFHTKDHRLSGVPTEAVVVTFSRVQTAISARTGACSHSVRELSAFRSAKLRRLNSVGVVLHSDQPWSLMRDVVIRPSAAMLSSDPVQSVDSPPPLPRPRARELWFKKRHISQLLKNQKTAKLRSPVKRHQFCAGLWPQTPKLTAGKDYHMYFSIIFAYYPRTYVNPKDLSIYLYMMMMSWCLMSSDVIWHIRDKLWPMPKHGSIKATYVRCMRV